MTSIFDKQQLPLATKLTPGILQLGDGLELDTDGTVKAIQAAPQAPVIIKDNPGNGTAANKNVMSQKGASALVFGTTNENIDQLKVQIGALAKALNRSTTAIGAGATANRDQDIAIGTTAIASNPTDIPIDTELSENIAIGQGSKAVGGNSIALGSAVIANNANTNSLATGLYSTALGAGAQATTVRSVALGSMSNMTSKNPSGNSQYRTDIVSVGSFNYNRGIANVKDPEFPQDAATKNYVDKLNSTLSNTLTTLSLNESDVPVYRDLRGNKYIYLNYSIYIPTFTRYYLAVFAPIIAQVVYFTGSIHTTYSDGSGKRNSVKDVLISTSSVGSGAEIVVFSDTYGVNLIADPPSNSPNFSLSVGNTSNIYTANVVLLTGFLRFV